MPSYYTYDERYPSTLNDPDAPPSVSWEDSRDWPKTYTVTAPNSGCQGYHPPAPVYQSSQPAMPQYYYGQAVNPPVRKAGDFQLISLPGPTDPLLRQRCILRPASSTRNWLAIQFLLQLHYSLLLYLLHSHTAIRNQL